MKKHPHHDAIHGTSDYGHGMSLPAPQADGFTLPAPQHGVSEKWIAKRVKSGAHNASPARLGKFLDKNEAKGIHPDPKRDAKRNVAQREGMKVERARKRTGGNESGWDKWKKKGGGKHGLSEAGCSGYDSDE